MSLFRERLDELIGGADSTLDIRAVVRRCYHYAFEGHSIRVWQGQGRLYTEDGNEWLGSVARDGMTDFHRVPSIQDGRDGASPRYEFTLGYIDQEIYEGLRTETDRVKGQPLTIYLALFQVGEGLRPQTPLEFFQELTMQGTAFEEAIVSDGTQMVRRYLASVIATDGNTGRSSIPGRTYADTMQKRHAASLGVPLDRGSEFLAGLANRSYKWP